MANYIITNNGLVNTDTLKHYGVKGMKWGKRKAQRLERRATRKYAKAGRKEGAADYYRERGDAAYKKHESLAKTFDMQAKKSAAEGNIWKAEAAKRSAAAIRARGENARASQYETADMYARSATRSKEKASAYATKKRVDLGKSKVDSILKENRTKGYERAKANEEFEREQQIQERYGDSGVDAYNRIRGTY